MRACALSASNARVCTVVLRAVSVCAVVHVVPFPRVGKIARLSPSAEDGRCRTPTLRVDTLPPRIDHTHPHSTYLSSTDLPRGRSTEDPGAPLLCAVCVSPSSLSSLLDLELRLPARMEKCMGQTAQKYMPQISPPGGHPATRKNTAIKGKNFTKPQRNQRKRHRRAPRRQTTRTTNTQKATSPPRAATGAIETARSKTSNQKAGETPQPRARGIQRRTEGRKAVTWRPPPPTRRTRRTPRKGRTRPRAEEQRRHNAKLVHEQHRPRPG